MHTLSTKVKTRHGGRMILSFTPLPDTYTIARLHADSSQPPWFDGPGLSAMARAEDELSLVCRSDRIPQGLDADKGWTALRFDTLAALDEPGVVAAAVTPISDAGLGVFVISTHLRDYILVRTVQTPRAYAALNAAGHTIA